MIPGTKICQKDLLWLTVIVFWFISYLFIFSVVLKESSFFRSLWPMDYLCRKTSEGHLMLKRERTMHPIYRYSCISWRRYSKNPKSGVSFSFVFKAFSRIIFFFLGLPIIKWRWKNELGFLFTCIWIQTSIIQTLGYPYPAALNSMSQSLIKNLHFVMLPWRCWRCWGWSLRSLYSASTSSVFTY